MKLTEDKIEDALNLLEEHYKDDNSPGLFSRRKARVLLEEGIDNPKSLILVNKDVTAILIFTLVSNFYSTAPSLQEVAFFSKTAGSGFRLLKEAIPWIKKWGDGVAGSYFLSTGNDKTNEMLERMGMKPMGVIFSMENL